jgi:hypothetical protein
MERYSKPVNHLPGINRYFFLKIGLLGEMLNEKYRIAGWLLGGLP